MVFSVYFDIETTIGEEEKDIVLHVGAIGRCHEFTYGEDADGNRGEQRYETVLCELKILTENSEDITNMILITDPGLYIMLSKEAERSLEREARSKVECDL